ncbi:MAG: choline kinase family protein [bacterium]
MKRNQKFLTTFLSGLLFCSYLSSQPTSIQNLEQQVMQWLKLPSISLQELHGGLTNTSFVATYKKKSFVVRLGKENPESLGINRLREIACHKCAAQIGIAPTILYSDPTSGTLISSFIHGKTLTATDVCTNTHLEKIVSLVKKCHAIPFKKEFETCSVYQPIREMLSRSMAYKNSFISDKQAEKIKSALNKIEAHFQEKEKTFAGLCHCDLLAGNFIDDGTKLWLIDWEYASWGNILFDLASLCIESNFDEEKTKKTLQLYFGQTWHNHYFDFKLVCTIFNLRNALWYDLRGKEIEVIGSVSMKTYAQKHLTLFWQDIDKLVPDTINAERALEILEPSVQLS